MISPIRIVMLEDDPIQAEWIAEEIIWRSHPGAELKYYDSEFSLMRALDEGKLNEMNPTHAILDLSSRYYSPQDLEDLDRDPEINKSRLSNDAGIRCKASLANRFPSIKIAIMTVLDVPEQADCPTFKKGGDELVTKLSNFLGMRV